VHPRWEGAAFDGALRAQAALALEKKLHAFSTAELAH
jgi:hypothetical protein